MAINYHEDSYGNPQREVVVYKESRMGPAPEIEGLEGIWEYFDAHESIGDIIQYGINEDGFLFAFTKSHMHLVSEMACKINGKWYSRAERLKQQG